MGNIPVGTSVLSATDTNEGRDVRAMNLSHNVKEVFAKIFPPANPSLHGHALVVSAELLPPELSGHV